MLAGPDVRTLSGASVSVGVGKPPNILFVFFAKFVFRVELAKKNKWIENWTPQNGKAKIQNKLLFV